MKGEKHTLKGVATENYVKAIYKESIMALGIVQLANKLSPNFICNFSNFVKFMICHGFCS